MKKGIEWGLQTHLEIFPTLMVENFRFISLFFFLQIFLMWAIFKAFVEFVASALCFGFVFFFSLLAVRHAGS